MRPGALLRQIYQFFLLLEVSELLAGTVTFVLCTLTVEDQEDQPLSSVRAGMADARGTFLPAATHSGGGQITPRKAARCPGCPSSSAKASVVTSIVLCTVHRGLSQGLVWKWETFGIPLQKGKDLVDALGKGNVACPATATSSSGSHCARCCEHRNRIQTALNSPISIQEMVGFQEKRRDTCWWPEYI